MEPTKVCTVCGEDKTLDCYGPHKKGKYGKNSRCRPCNNTVSSQWYKANIDKAYVQRNVKAFGLSPEQYASMLEASGGRCAICNKVPTERLVLDHCHKTGVIRGLLCRKCNTGIGLLGDDFDSVLKAVAYLDPDVSSRRGDGGH